MSEKYRYEGSLPEKKRPLLESLVLCLTCTECFSIQDEIFEQQLSHERQQMDDWNDRLDQANGALKPIEKVLFKERPFTLEKLQDQKAEIDVRNLE